MALPLVADFARDRFNDMIVRRVVPFSADPRGTLILNCFPKDPRPGVSPAGLLYRRPVGLGTVYTIATLPDREFTNLEFHPLFLPLLVRMAQRPPARSEAQNIELGRPITLIGRQFEAFPSITLADPQNDMTVVKAIRSPTGVEFPFGPATVPGLYTWMKPAANDAMAMTNVQLPAGESELVYTPASLTTDPGEQVTISRSVKELQASFAHRGEPKPQWALPIALVLVLLCMEAAMASIARMWKPGVGKAVVAGVAH